MWIPLHLHSQYSILDASASVEAIAKRAADYGMPAVALTDHGNLHGAIEFYKVCKAAGVKPIIGCEFYVAPESRLDKKKSPGSGRTSFHLTILAKDEEGYHNLCRLTSLGYLEGFYYYPRIDKELLKKNSKGLICLSGCLASEVSQTILSSKNQEYLETIAWYHDLFGEDYYLELQRHTMSSEKVDRLEESWLVQHYHDFIQKQEKVNQTLIEAGKKLGIKCVATNDTHYMDPEDWQAHEILLNIQSGEPVEIWETDRQGQPQFRIPNPKRRVYASRELYFKSAEEMQALFSDFPEAISNTLEVSEKCNLKIDFETKHYPIFIPPGYEGKKLTKDEHKAATDSFLRTLCEEGIQRRYSPARLEKVAEKYPGKDPALVVRERLEREFEIVTSKGMCDYLLIVWDFINWAKKQGIPVGPGRGSGVGSIILYLIGVTDIEPLRFHLFFERFINPERLSYPDIDVDICMDRRQEVIDYTVRKYGKENVAQIITFGTMKAKMTIKDVGRVLSVPLTKVNAIAKLVPEDPQMTLSKALELDADLNAFYVSDPDAKRIIDVGRKLEGSIRNTGIHAAGLIICGEPLTDHIPICLAKDSEMAATQYSMKPVESVGMLKIDFLGLKTLTSIEIAVKALEKSEKKIDWVNLSLEDQATFELLHEGKTLGVFQMESGGMQELARQLRPDKFEEIIAIGALYRPGPMDMIPSFISRKHKQEPIEYDHAWMEQILAETYGIMVYQEQVMQIATELANYTLGEGDILRKAMGKKDAAQMGKEREKFRQGALSNGLSEEAAMVIFDKMEKFASYGFNKSHAAAYGYLTYVTAYLKANHPKEWMAALLTCDRDDVSKVAKFIRECLSMGIQILPPDINEAGKTFLATSEGIRFAMTGVKGVGEGVVDAIIEERQAKGPFKSFYHFFQRIDVKKVGKKTIELLVDAGSFDFTGWSRDALKLKIEEFYDNASKQQKDKQAGVLTFFSLMGDERETASLAPPTVLQPTSKSDLLRKEKELLGFYLTGHPMDAFKPILDRLSCIPLCKLDDLEHQAVARSAFIIEQAETKIASKTQKKFAILRISDGMETYELPIWSELYEEKAPLLQENQLLYAVLQVDKREDTLKLSCRWLDDLTKADEKMIEVCDKAYDKAKAYGQRFTKGPPRNPPPPAKELPMSKNVIPYSIKVDIEKIRLSQILKLKDLLKSSPGSQPVRVEFFSEEKAVGVIQIEGDRGISLHPELEKSIKAVLIT